MNVTLDLLECLLARGWSIRGTRLGIEYREPNGISGSDYIAGKLDQFPPAVEEWIWVNVPLTADRR